MKRNKNKFALILALCVVVLSKLMLFAQTQNQASTSLPMSSMKSVDHTTSFKLDARIAEQIPHLQERIAIFSFEELPKYGYVELNGNKAGSIEFNPKANHDSTTITIGTTSGTTQNNILMSKCGFGQLIAQLALITP